MNKTYYGHKRNIQEAELPNDIGLPFEETQINHYEKTKH
jgi:hypothetical protein